MEEEEAEAPPKKKEEDEGSQQVDETDWSRVRPCFFLSSGSRNKQSHLVSFRLNSYIS